MSTLNLFQDTLLLFASLIASVSLQFSDYSRATLSRMTSSTGCNKPEKLTAVFRGVARPRKPPGVITRAADWTVYRGT